MLHYFPRDHHPQYKPAATPHHSPRRSRSTTLLRHWTLDSIRQLHTRGVAESEGELAYRYVPNSDMDDSTWTTVLVIDT